MAGIEDLRGGPEGMIKVLMMSFGISREEAIEMLQSGGQGPEVEPFKIRQMPESELPSRGIPLLRPTEQPNPIEDQYYSINPEEGPYGPGLASGGRIGYQVGGSGDRNPIYQDVSRWLYAKDVQDLTDDEYLRLIKFTRENDAQGGRAGRAQGGRIGYAGGTNNSLDTNKSIF